MTLPLGSKVWLKSGGPDMLVVEISFDHVLCAYKLDGQEIELKFNPLMLTTKKPNKRG